MNDDRCFRIDVTKEEYNLIQNHRIERFKLKERQALVKSCNHRFNHAGHGHNGSFSQCSICGEYQDD